MKKDEFSKDNFLYLISRIYERKKIYGLVDFISYTSTLIFYVIYSFMLKDVGFFLLIEYLIFIILNIFIVRYFKKQKKKFVNEFIVSDNELLKNFRLYISNKEIENDYISKDCKK